MNQHQQDQPKTDLPKLAAPAYRALSGVGITRLEHLTQITEAEMSALHGIGPNTLKTLREALDANGLSYKPPTG